MKVIDYILPFIHVIIPQKMNQCIYPSPFTNRVATPDSFCHLFTRHGCLANPEVSPLPYQQSF